MLSSRLRKYLAPDERRKLLILHSAGTIFRGSEPFSHNLLNAVKTDGEMAQSMSMLSNHRTLLELQ